MKTHQKIRELRRTLRQTQEAFAATVGASKDTVASWETGRNELSAALARRIALATGVDEVSLRKANVALRTLALPRRPFTKEEFARHQRTFWGGDAETSARRHAARCADAMGLLFLAAAKSAKAGTLGGVLGSFIQWCEETRERFDLGPAIDAQLEQRKGRLELTKSYGQWREMAKTDPNMTRIFGFRDDLKRDGAERLTRSLETVPIWAPGQSMRGGKGKR